MIWPFAEGPDRRTCVLPLAGALAGAFAGAFPGAGWPAGGAALPGLAPLVVYGNAFRVNTI